MFVTFLNKENKSLVVPLRNDLHKYITNLQREICLKMIRIVTNNLAFNESIFNSILVLVGLKLFTKKKDVR